jgi:hypothetical protein
MRARLPRLLVPDFWPTIQTGRLNAQDRQFFRAVGAQHEDALNVAGSAWTGDERDETWIVRCVFAPQQRERGGQVWEELLPTGEDNVVRGQH